MKRSSLRCSRSLTQGALCDFVRHASKHRRVETETCYIEVHWPGICVRVLSQNGYGESFHVRKVFGFPWWSQRARAVSRSKYGDSHPVEILHLLHTRSRRDQENDILMYFGPPKPLAPTYHDDGLFHVISADLPSNLALCPPSTI